MAMSQTDNSPPAEWTEVISEIVDFEPRRVMVIGEPDVGKSTFCIDLLNHAAAVGKRAWLLDGDLGQKSVGPPACVTLGRLHAGSTLGLDSLVFVGATSPLAGWSRLIDGLVRLSNRPESMCLINTSGLLGGPGLRLKMTKIRALNPDLLVLIGEHAALHEVVREYPDIETRWLVASPLARPKSPSVRRRNRQNALHEYLQSAREQVLELRAMQVDGEPARLAEQGLLIGLSSKESPSWQLGVADKLKPASGRLKVVAPPAKDAEIIRLGSLRVSTTLVLSPVQVDGPKSE